MKIKNIKKLSLHYLKKTFLKRGIGAAFLINFLSFFIPILTKILFLGFYCNVNDFSEAIKFVRNFPHFFMSRIYSNKEAMRVISLESRALG
jgi:hypothetical protein